MMSPFKTIEFDLDNTPSKKKVVDNEINGWMQTCVKKNQSLDRRRKLPCRFIISRSLNKQEELMKFKEYRNQLVQHALEKYSEKTAASQNRTGKMSTPSAYLSENHNSKGEGVKNVEVSQFLEKQTHEIIIFNENTKIALLRLPELPKKRTLPIRIPHLQDPSSNMIDSKQPNAPFLPSKYITRRKLTTITRI